MAEVEAEAEVVAVATAEVVARYQRSMVFSGSGARVNGIPSPLSEGTGGGDGGGLERSCSASSRLSLDISTTSVMSFSVEG